MKKRKTNNSTESRQNLPKSRQNLPKKRIYIKNNVKDAEVSHFFSIFATDIQKNRIYLAFNAKFCR